MSISSLGIRASDGIPLFREVEECEFASWYLEDYEDIHTKLYDKYNKLGLNYSSLDDPKIAEWRIIIHPDDTKILEIDELKQLIELRCGDCKSTPLFYNCRSHTIDEWAHWLETNYYPLGNLNEDPPYYILIIGEPEKIPFGFQRFLHTVASIGRICFNNLDDYRTYFKKVLHHECVDNKSRKKSELTIFAPNHDDVTINTVQNFAQHLKEWAESHASHISFHDFIDNSSDEKKAVKKNFQKLLKSSSGVMFSIGHGYFDDTGRHELHNGGLCCPEVNVSQLLDLERDVFTSNDIENGIPCLKNGIIFQYGCFTYGTPDVSTIEHWLHNKTKRYWSNEFVSSLPQKMLAHPDGPIGYIGHLDAAVIYMKNTNDQKLEKQLLPIKWTLECLLKENRTIGYSMRGMRNIHLGLNNTIVAEVNLKQQLNRDNLLLKIQNLEQTHQREFIRNMIWLNDVSNFMVFGDPAVRPGRSCVAT